MNYDEFIASRPRDWWRSYYRDTVKSAESLLERSLTLAERKRVVRIIRQRRDQKMLGSSGVLGMMVSCVIEEPERWEPVWGMSQ